MKKHPLRSFREKLKISQDDLARLLGVKPISISRWERGTRVPARRLWPTIKEKTGIQPAQFVEFTRGAAE